MLQLDLDFRPDLRPPSKKTNRPSGDAFSEKSVPLETEVGWGDLQVGRNIQPRLLRWFAKYQRDLPWRGTNDPYAIWVSEIMLQQTQVGHGHSLLPSIPQNLPHGRAPGKIKSLKRAKGLGRPRILFQGQKPSPCGPGGYEQFRKDP